MECLRNLLTTHGTRRARDRQTHIPYEEIWWLWPRSHLLIFSSTHKPTNRPTHCDENFCSHAYQPTLGHVHTCTLEKHTPTHMCTPSVHHTLPRLLTSADHHSAMLNHGICMTVMTTPRRSSTFEKHGVQLDLAELILYMQLEHPFTNMNPTSLIHIHNLRSIHAYSSVTQMVSTVFRQKMPLR